MLIIQLEIVR